MSIIKQLIETRTCSVCGKKVSSDPIPTFGGGSPFEGWMHLDIVSRFPGMAVAPDYPQADFCSYLCLVTYGEQHLPKGPNIHHVCCLLASMFYYGMMVPETANEELLCNILKEHGYWAESEERLMIILGVGEEGRVEERINTGLPLEHVEALAQWTGHHQSKTVVPNITDQKTAQEIGRKGLFKGA